MTPFSIGPAQPGRLGELARLAADAQADPERFVAYFARSADDIESEVRALGDVVVATTMVASRAERAVGWIAGETERELGRVWWWGPVVGAGEPWDDVADALYTASRAALDTAFDQEELAVDARSARFEAFAARHGFEREAASAVLHVAIGATATDQRVAELTPADADQVAALHDLVFPGRHMTGAQLVDAEDGLRLVMRTDDRVVGYVAFEVQADGDGYLDFLGVDPARRGRGVGTTLVASALDVLRRSGAPGANLTVRDDNLAARRLYRRLGFEEERIVRPYRKGFSLRS